MTSRKFFALVMKKYAYVILEHSILLRQITVANFCAGVSKSLKYVIDVTIAYPDGYPFGLPDVVFGFQNGCKTSVYYRVYPVSSIPQDEESLVLWLYARYKEKDQLLDRFYRTGTFFNSTSKNGSPESISNDPCVTERTLCWNPRWCWMIHAFYLSSTCGFTYGAFWILRAVFTLLCHMVA
jgi:Acyltransferase C-terminus